MVEGSIYNSRDKTTFNNEREHLECPRVESLILEADVAEMEKLRVGKVILARNRVDKVLSIKVAIP